MSSLGFTKGTKVDVIDGVPIIGRKDIEGHQ